jgi:hypothetical protein
MANLKSRVGVFLIGQMSEGEQQHIFPSGPNGTLAAFESEFEGDEKSITEASQVVLLQAYIDVSLRTNLVITTQNLKKMDVQKFIEDGVSVECHYFYLAGIDKSTLKIQPLTRTKRVATLNDELNFRDFVITPFEEAVQSPMLPATKHMFRVLGITHFEPSASAYVGYAERPGQGAAATLQNPRFLMPEMA